MAGPVRLDGAAGEGGGQILRMAAALSVITGRPMEVTDIRANRAKPGLRPQHAAVLRFLAAFDGGTVHGAEVGSRSVRFEPGGARTGGRHLVDLRTAGSITLFLQAVVPVLLATPGETELVVRGGTDAAHAPPFDWYRDIHLHRVAPYVDRLEVEVRRRGFYPRGGGEVRLRVDSGLSSLPDPAALGARFAAAAGDPAPRRGPLVASQVSSVASDDLADAEVAERQTGAADRRLRRRTLQAGGTTSTYVATASIGSVTTAWVEDDSGHRLGSSALGARGVRAEAVGHTAVVELLEDLETDATVDRWMADQMVPYVAFGAPPVKVPRITGHLETNIETCRAFLGPDVVRLDGHVLKNVVPPSP